MQNLKKYAILIIVALTLIYLLSIRPDGYYFVPVAELIKKKGEAEKFTPEHNLDLEKYRPNIHPQN